MDATGKIFLGLDCNIDRAVEVSKLVHQHPAIAGLKMNMLADEAMYKDVGGTHLFRVLADLGLPLWLDFKFHDTTGTVAKRVAIHAHNFMVKYMTVMAKGEVDMMIDAVYAAGDVSKIIAVTELTSLTEEQVNLTSGLSPKASVIQLARNAVLSGIKYLVCSAQELEVVAGRRELDVLTPIVPGIKLGDTVNAGQNRTGTPTDVLTVCPKAKLVIASGIVKADDPMAALDQAVTEIEAV